MAAPLRTALTALVWVAAAVIYLPLLPSACLLIVPACHPANWRTLFADTQLIQATAATLVSSLIAMAGALLIALCVIAALWPSAAWQRLATRLPLMLAIPHVAFASAALLLFAEGGQLYQLLPSLTAPVDRYGIGLGITLAVKESVFLLWAAYALPGESLLRQQSLVLRSQGYGRWQCLAWIIVPRLLPQLKMVLLATLAWTLSTVDVALVLGPGNPPTLAVLAWQWLSQGDVRQDQGALACLLLLLIMAALALLALAAWRLYLSRIPDFCGVRRPRPAALPGRLLARLLPLSSLLAVGTMVLLSRWQLPEQTSALNTLGLGVLSSLLAGGLSLLWLEYGPRRFRCWIWLPLLLPALPLAAGQYQLALLSWQDGKWLTVLWGHLLWVLPWMLFILQPAWQHLDPRQIVIARTLGWSRERCFWQLKCPLLIRPLLSALAVGFSVSVAQYLPSLWLGGGRIPTLTVDAVALSSGGSEQQLATQALWQLLLPAIFFMLIAALMRLAGRYRQGLR